MNMCRVEGINRRGMWTQDVAHNMCATLCLVSYLTLYYTVMLTFGCGVITTENETLAWMSAINMHVVVKPETKIFQYGLITGIINSLAEIPHTCYFF